MGQIIAVANQKGGVGKTTLTIHLGAFASHHEKRVILIDADPQGNLTSYLLDRNLEEAGIVNLLAGRVPALKAVVPVRGEWQFGLVPGNWRTGQALSELARDSIPFSIIAQQLRPLAQHADYVLIDMPPSRAPGFLRLLYTADLMLIPTQLERLSIEGVGFMADAAQYLIEERGSGPQLLGIIPNLYRQQTNEHKHYLELLIKQFGAVVWPPISSSIRVTEACSDGKSLFTYAPEEKVTATMIQVCERFLENTR